jgi:DNA-binding protein H-NS
MKKVFTLVAVASMFTFVACGPSAEEKAKMEKMKQDSIAAVEAANAAKMQATADSTAAYAAAEEAKAKATADSMAAASAAKPAKGGKAKPAAKPAEPKKNEVKAGQGKG